MFIIVVCLWIVFSIGIYAFAPRSYAMWVVLLGGWLLLPPAMYLAAGDRLVFPFWIIGSALPSDLLIAKAWMAPMIAICCSLIFDRRRWFQIRYHWTDLAMIAFCVWPLGQSLFVKQSNPSNILSSLYLFGSWGMPWLIGRLYLRNHQDTLVFTAILALSTLLMLPFILIESVSSYRIYTAFFGTHPFAFNGVERYIGFRPQLFFENGNQYGIWCAGATIAAFWRLKAARTEERRSWILVFYLLLAITTASQSVGAILLMLGGLAMLSIQDSFRVVHAFFAAAFAVCLLLGTLHISGMVPLRKISENTVAGKKVVDVFQAMGRGSFVWRFGQDVKALPLLQRDIVIGTGRWDWFMGLRSRPWGLPLIVIGQFGLVGLALLAAALIGALYRHLVIAVRGSAPSRLVTVVLFISIFDALLNSFVFYPAIMVASALFCGERANQAVLPTDH